MKAFFTFKNKEIICPKVLEEPKVIANKQNHKKAYSVSIPQKLYELASKDKYF